MTRDLRGLFEQMLEDEPPLELTVDDIVSAGAREVAGRRRLVGLSLAAVLLLVVGLAAAVEVTSGGGEGSVSVTAPPAASGPDEPPVSVTTTQPPATSTTSTTGRTTTMSSPPAGVAAEEELPDPGFEADPLGWSTFGPATVLTPVPDARTGKQALEIATTSATQLVAGATNRPVLVETVAGRRYEASCWVRSAAPIDAVVQLQEYTKDWERAGDPAPSPTVTLIDPTRWYQLTVTYTAQNSGNQLPLSIFSPDLAPTTPTLLVDDCSLKPQP
jgi:hypothetical protein